jgi:hypothetical protein
VPIRQGDITSVLEGPTQLQIARQLLHLHRSSWFLNDAWANGGAGLPLTYNEHLIDLQQRTATILGPDLFLASNSSYVHIFVTN